MRKTKKELDKECQLLEKKLERVLQDPEFKKLIQKREELKHKTAGELAKLIKRHEGKHLHDLLNSAGSRVLNPPSTATLGVPGMMTMKVSDRVPKSEQLRILTDVLMTHVRSLGKFVDSDATESSSAGDSCDECDGDLVKRGMKQCSKRKESETKKFPHL